MYCQCLTLAPCPIPSRWHHVFTPVCSVPEPSRMKLLPMSFGVTNEVCLWEFYKTHTNCSERTAPPVFLTTEGHSRLTVGPTKPKRRGASSVFDGHWLLRVFEGTHSTPLPPTLPFRLFTRRWVILPSLVSVVSGWGTFRGQPLGIGLNTWVFSESWITVLPWLLPTGLQDHFNQKKETSRSEVWRACVWTQTDRWKVSTECTSHLWDQDNH